MILAKVEQAKELSKKGYSFSKIEDQIDISRVALPFLIELYEEMIKKPVVVKDLICVKKKYLLLRSIKLQNRLADFRISHKKRLEELKKRKRKLIEMGHDLQHIDDLHEEVKMQQQAIIKTVNQFEQVEAELFEEKKYKLYNMIFAYLAGMASTFFILWLMSIFIL